MLEPVQPVRRAYDHRRPSRRRVRSVLCAVGLLCVAVPANARDPLQAQLGLGMRTPDTGFAVDGFELWSNFAASGLGLEAGIFYRHRHPDRTGGARLGIGLRPLAALGLEIWEFIDFPVHAGALLGAHEAGFYAGLLTEIGVEVTPIPDGVHPIVGLRMRWARDDPATRGPTLLLTIALRMAD